MKIIVNIIIAGMLFSFSSANLISGINGNMQNFLSMNGYGLFVWGSFAITFIACGLLYYKTFKKLKMLTTKK